MEVKDLTPIDGCDECAYLTEAFEEPTCCIECAIEQKEANNGT